MADIKQLNSLQDRQEIRQLHSRKQQYLWIRYSGILEVSLTEWKMKNPRTRFHLMKQFLDFIY